jgi:hypothetical protein
MDAYKKAVSPWLLSIAIVQLVCGTIMIANGTESFIPSWLEWIFLIVSVATAVLFSLVIRNKMRKYWK